MEIEGKWAPNSDAVSRGDKEAWTLLDNRRRHANDVAATQSDATLAPMQDRLLAEVSVITKTRASVWASHGTDV